MLVTPLSVLARHRLDSAPVCPARSLSEFARSALERLHCSRSLLPGLNPYKVNRRARTAVYPSQREQSSLLPKKCAPFGQQLTRLLINVTLIRPRCHGGCLPCGYPHVETGLIDGDHLLV
jgi:hypothetical protein